MKNVLCLVLSCSSVAAAAADYNCTVERKLEHHHDYTADEMQRGKFSNLVEETTEGTFVSRCSFSPSQGRVTCDRYKADRIEVDQFVKIKKLYFFRSQFNLQIFTNMSFIEDNGRGSISFGTCKLIAP